jgi:hypothetical protein
MLHRAKMHALYRRERLARGSGRIQPTGCLLELPRRHRHGWNWMNLQLLIYLLPACMKLVRA